MNILTINQSNHEPKNKRYKVRAIVENDEGKIILCDYAGVTMLVGGSIDGNETPHEAINRELYEELGIYADEMEYLFTIKHNQFNYPNKNNTYEERQLITHFYYIRCNGPIVRKNLTMREKTHGYNAYYADILDIYNKLNNITGNPKKEFFDDELSLALSQYFTLKSEREDISNSLIKKLK